MNALDIFLLALNSIKHRSLRSWLAILGVIIGVASIISLISISTGLQDQVSRQLSSLGAQIITITPGGGQASRFSFGRPAEPLSGGQEKPLTFKDAQALSELPGVRMADARISKTAAVSYKNKNSSVSVVGTSPRAFLSSSNAQISQGRSLRESDGYVAVLGAQVANRTFQGEELLNKQIKINGKPFRVVGILNASGASFSGIDNQIFIPQKTAMELFEQDENASSIILVAEPNWDPEAVAQSASNLLARRHKVSADKLDFRIITASSIQSTISSTIDTLGLFLGIIASISLVVGGIGVANSMFTSVLEQTRYIGILKSLGARRSEILMLFLFEAAIMGLAGGILGVGLSFAGSFAISSVGLPTKISPELIFLGMAFSVIAGCLSGIFPALSASKVEPVEALRYE